MKSALNSSEREREELTLTNKDQEAEIRLSKRNGGGSR